MSTKESEELNKAYLEHDLRTQSYFSLSAYTLLPSPAD
jgi:hypothetical protein